MRDNTRIPELDGLRGLAVLMVVMWHCFVSPLTVHGGSVLSYLKFGLGYTWSGVDLFFVLSGFLIGGILIDNRKSANYYKTFYSRRLCRIFPLYYAFLVCFGVASLIITEPWLREYLFKAHPPLFSQLAYLQNFAMAQAGTLGGYWLAPTWSLAVEEQFYLLIPVVIRHVSPRKLMGVLFGLIVGAIVFRVACLVASASWPVSTYVISFSRMDSLAMGVLAAVLLRRRRLSKSLCYSGLIVSAVLTGYMLKMRWSPDAPGMAVIGYTALGLMYTWLLLTSLTDSSVARCFRFAPLRKLGTVAYCVYLIHLPANAIVHWLAGGASTAIVSPTDFLISLVGFALTVGFASLSWKYFEKPLVSLGHRYAYATDRSRTVNTEARPVSNYA